MSDWDKRNNLFNKQITPREILNFLEVNANFIFWFMTIIYIGIFSYLSYQKLITFNYFDWDFASDVSLYWNSLHNKFLFYPFLGQHIFGYHFYLIILLILPVYAIFQHPATVLFLQTIAIGLSGYALYLLAKRKLSNKLALFIILIYFLYPPIGFINLFETHFDVYALLFLSFALFFFEMNRFRSFILFIFLASACKENVSLIVLMFGFYALIKRKDLKWVLFPFLFGLFWFILSIKFVIPYFSHNSNLEQNNYLFSVYYKHLGNNFFEIAKTIILHPIRVIQFIFIPRKIIYILSIFLPSCFIGFLAPSVLIMSLPVFLQNLLSLGFTHAQIYYHYLATIIPFVFVSFIFGLKRLFKRIKLTEVKFIILCVILSCSILSGVYYQAPQSNLLKLKELYRVNPVSIAKTNLLKLIPADASVMASFQFLPSLAQRKNLFSFHFVAMGNKMYSREKYIAPKDLDFVVIDFNDQLLVSSFFGVNSSDNIREFIGANNLFVLSAFDDVVLFKKDYREGPKLCEIKDSFVINNRVDAVINDNLTFLGYNISKSKEEKGNLALEFFWKRSGSWNDDCAFFIEFVDKDGMVVLVKIHMFGYRAYVPRSIPANMILMENYFPLGVEFLKPGTYSLYAGLVSADGKIYPIKDQKENVLPRISLGEFVLNK